MKRHLTQDELERETKITHQQVSRWAARLKNPERYRQMLYGSLLRKAMAEQRARREPPEAESIIVDPQKISLRHGDMLDNLTDLNGKVDLVIADPPYNVTKWEWDQRGTVDEFMADTKKWLEAMAQTLRPKYHLFWFCSPKFLEDIGPVLRSMFPVQSRIIWHRRNMATLSNSTERFIDTWEMIYHCGSKRLNWSDEPWTDERFDVQIFASPQSNFTDQSRHPTQKPIGLIKRLVEFGSYDGDLVLDPFAGSGTTGHACVLVGDRRCVLIEKEPGYAEVIKSRLVGVG
jgi:DNA modification methylase